VLGENFILEILPCIPAVKIFARLDIDETISFLDGDRVTADEFEGSRWKSSIGIDRLYCPGT
jgi:hypothetical protein